MKGKKNKKEDMMEKETFKEKMGQMNEKGGEKGTGMSDTQHTETKHH